MNKLILISLILGTVFSAKPATYASTVTEGAFTLKYGPDDADKTIIWYEFSHTGNNGWISIGLGTLAQMANMDIWKFTYDGSNIVATDQNVMKFTQPNDDATNDLNLDAANSSYATDTNAWKVTFSRKMDTADEKDAKIVCGENPISFAIGADQENSKHSAAPTSSKITIAGEAYGCTTPDDTGASILVSSMALLAIIAALLF